MRPFSFLCGASLLFVLSLGHNARAQEESRPQPANVLFVIVDDLNDMVGPLGGAPRAKTPCLDRLADSGVVFTNAHCASPACNSSRAALLTGVRPHVSGIYHSSNQPFRTVLPDVKTLPQTFREAGYAVRGAGKVFHNRYPDPASWESYFPALDRPRPQDPKPPQESLPANGLAGMPEVDWAPLDVRLGKMGDRRVANWIAARLAEPQERPFFLGCGMFRTHWPWYVPREFFDLYSDDDLTLPLVRKDDLADLPPMAVERTRFPADWHPAIVKADQWRAGVHAYLAATSFVDDQIGRMLDALAESPFADNTFVVVFSDHGLHLGEKEHWGKFSPWEESTRVPLLIAGPGIEGGRRCSQPVSLMDLYPTLLELTGRPAQPSLSGTSLVPWLENPDLPRNEPALTTVERGSHTVRSRDWRYIRWADGSEELYDHRNDPNEWLNLAGREEHAEIQRELATWIPAESAKDAPAEGKSR